MISFPPENAQPCQTDREIIAAMEAYQSAGLSVLPAHASAKRPTLSSWSEYQTRTPTDEEITQWTSTNPESLCIVCGRVSGNLELIDFDLEGAMYQVWRESVETLRPGLLGRLVIESSPSGGFHVVYRCETEVCGNVKLASKEFVAIDDEPIIIGGKEYRPRKSDNGLWAVTVVAIETRGEGGLFLCAPSPGYAIIQGDLSRPPTISKDERDILLGCAWKLDESKGGREIIGASPAGPSTAGLRPGDDFNTRGDPRPMLISHGWVKTRDGLNECWRRPGKVDGASATLKDGVFYVFSSNAAPFEPSKGYSPFAVYTLLEHNGDFTASAASLAGLGFGSKPKAPGVDLSRFCDPLRPPNREIDDSEFLILPIQELIARYPRLRTPVIHGLLREGETMNLIAAPKTGKSWLTLDLAIAVATGQPWLGRFPTEQGKVLIIDNELHPETTAYRVPTVMRARDVSEEQLKGRLFIDNLRGNLCDIFALSKYFEPVQRDQFKVVVLDAFYRFMPVDKDENDNGTMSNIYNCIDRIATEIGCCFVMIHHTSKGSQSGKSVSDVGAGAGAQSRAADVHAVLRPHQEEGAVVLDAMARSWPPVQPVALRWVFPVWNADESLDPSELKVEHAKRKRREEKQPKKKDETPTWNVDEFVNAFLGEEPISFAELREKTRGVEGLSWRQAKDFTELAESREFIFRRTVGSAHKVQFSTVPPEPREEGDEA